MVNNTYQGNMNCAPVNKRVLYFDLLNIFATIAVVYLHCNGIVHTYTKGMSWAASLIIEVIFYWAVPIFFYANWCENFKFPSQAGHFHISEIPNGKNILSFFGMERHSVHISF